MQETISIATVEAVKSSLIRGSYNYLFVDINHPYASDRMGNRGNSQLSPFRTIERALSEVARRSFVPGVQNDKTASTTVFVYPGIYDVNNGFGGTATDFTFNSYQQSARLIFANRKWAADKSAFQELTRLVVNAVISDLSRLGNSATIGFAKQLRNTDGSFPADYSDSVTRQNIIDSLGITAIDLKDAIANLAPVTNFVFDIDSVTLGVIQASIQSLIDVIKNTLNETVNPWELSANPGSIQANFPKEGEPTSLNLQGFNSSYKAGIIVPRGCTIVFLGGIRTSVVRPKYVPPKDGSEGKSAVFRLTGDSFITGMCLIDKPGLQSSHHNLYNFEYVNLQDLQDYYYKIVAIFGDQKLYNQLQDAANLVEQNINWIIKKTKENVAYISAVAEIRQIFDAESRTLLSNLVADLRSGGNANITRFASNFTNSYILSILPAPARNAAISAHSDILDVVSQYIRLAVINEAEVLEGGYIDSRIVVDASVNRCSEIRATVTTLIDIVKTAIAGNPPPQVNPGVFSIGDVEVVPGENTIVGAVVGTSVLSTTRNASAYVFNCSVRSDWGINGVYIDGDNVEGYKSFLAAQYTVYSIQQDIEAFLTTVNQGDVANKRYKGTKTGDLQDFRHHGFYFDNESYAQLVSCFVIGPAIHYRASNGAIASINNSVSNFGDTSMLAEGYKSSPFPQDTGYIWHGIIKPKLIQRTGIAITELVIGDIESYDFNSITLVDPLEFGSIAPFTLRPGTNIYINVLGVVYFATVGAPGVNSESANKKIIPIASFSDGFSTSVIGRNAYIRRITDRRSPKDKLYKLIVEAPTGSRGNPVENYILQINNYLTKQQNKVFFIANIEKLGNRYALTILEGYRNAEGESASYQEAIAEIDTDYEPDSPLIKEVSADNFSYLAAYYLLSCIGIPEAVIEQILEVGSVDYFWETPKIVNFLEPSTLRGSHTWEYMGYYNPDTAFPQAQTSVLGAGLSEKDAFKKKLSKLFTNKSGGRVYTTGMGENGDYFLGQTLINARTGTQQDLRSGTPNQGAYATTEEPGLVRLATQQEAANGTSNNSVITPSSLISSLQQWRSKNKILSAASGNIRIFVGDFVITGISYTSISFDDQYSLNYYPQPSFDVNNNNPGKQFKPFKTIRDAAAWCNSELSPSQTAELIIAPGYHYLDGEFQCNLIINGAYGNGSYGAGDDPTKSVLLYKRFVAMAEPLNGPNGRVLSVIGLGGGITVKGSAASYIVNIFFVSPVQAYSYLNQIVNQSAIEHFLYNSIQSDWDSLPSQVNYGLSGGNWQSVIKKINGTIIFEKCVFLPQLPYFIFPIREGVSGYIDLLDAHLYLRGIAIRGNELFVFPKNIAKAGKTYQIANSIQGWTTAGYWSDVSGNFVGNQITATHLTTFGHSQTFITVSGKCSLTMSDLGITKNDLPERNYNDDRNNLRIESSHNTLQDLSASDRSDSTLGNRGIPNLTGDAVVQEIKSARGPIIQHFLWFNGSNSSLRVTEASFSIWGGVGNTRTGWKGQFGYIPSTSNGSFLGTSIKTQGVVFNPFDYAAANTLDVKDYVSFFRGNNIGGFWTAAMNPLDSQKTQIENAVLANVFYKSLSRGFYSNNLTINVNSQNPVPVQVAASSDNPEDYQENPATTGAIVLGLSIVRSTVI